MISQDMIYLLSCAVNRETPDAQRAAGMDLDKLYEKARRHMVTSAVGYGLEAAGIKDARFVRAQQSAALKSSTMDIEMEALLTELDAAGIWYMPLKGIVLQHLYPIYGMRQMSDHDILSRHTLRREPCQRCPEDHGKARLYCGAFRTRQPRRLSQETRKQFRDAQSAVW